MRALKFFICIFFQVCVLILLSCKTQKHKLIGAWEFVEDESCDNNFLGLTPYIFPSARYGHKIYFTDSLFYNPYVTDKKYRYLPFEEVYSLKKGKVFIPGLDPFEFKLKDSILLLESAGCKLTFRRVLGTDLRNKVEIEKISFSSRSNDNNLLDSIQIYQGSIWVLQMPKSVKESEINTKKYIESLVRIAESIDTDDYDKIFDSGMSDTDKYTIEFLLKNGEAHKIISYGKYKTPFEVKTLISYLLKN